MRLTTEKLNDAFDLRNLVNLIDFQDLKNSWKPKASRNNEQ
jgi:hypothetical protein